MSEVQRDLLMSEADLREHADDLSRLECARAQLRLSAQHHGLSLEATAAVVGAVDDAGFVMTVSAAQDDEPMPHLGLATGPLDHLFDELMLLIPGWPCGVMPDEDTHAQRARRAEWVDAPVHFADVVLLAALVSEGNADGVQAALEVTEMPDLPEWIREAAFGLEGTLSLTLTMIDGRTNGVDIQGVWDSLLLLPSGWLSVGCNKHEELTALPMSHRDVQTTLISACSGLVRATAQAMPA